MFLALNVNINAKTGDAVHVRELVMNLAELGNHIVLIQGSREIKSNNISALENHSNIELYYNNKNIFKIKFPLSRDISTILNCLKAARKNPPDVIYERTFSSKIGTVLSKILRKPLIVEVNGLIEDEAKLQGTYKDHKFTKNIRMKFRRYFYNSANKIVAVTAGIKEELQKTYHIPSDKIIVIPNGANTEIFRPMDQNIVKKELGLDKETKYICFVGNLAPWQGVEYFVQTAPIVLKKVPEAKFLIVGEGAKLRELKSMVKKLKLEEKFLFTGSIPFEDVPKYINASDICVAPKKIIKSGYSPLKLFEYMSCGKPVIATNTHGFEILEYNNAGILINPENSDEFAETIVDLLLNEKLINVMGKNGRQVVINNYSWGNTAKHVVKVCKKTLS